ncbi:MULTISPECIES: restriction endonuclease [unclassified Bradyrhizobium]|uniref:restriction endonuclease n=1 Tax=unclassified Bradyrhizobium TaxID=2631580 RepID=UPI0028F0453C|nr:MULTISPECIES: restriction endonuclease [unclassified Bradyrhizobium]
MVIGQGAIGSYPIGGGLSLDTHQRLIQGSTTVKLVVSGLIIPEKRVGEGILLKSASSIWDEIARRLSNDWNVAYQLSPQTWEEIVAGAFHKSGYEVVLTPRTGDHGRDVIAVKSGIGCIKIIGSVKAYRQDRLVSYDDVRALIGVMSGERDVSKGLITTTSDFPPNIERDPFIAPFLPTRLELVNFRKLQKWLTDLDSPSSA